MTPHFTAHTDHEVVALRSAEPVLPVRGRAGRRVAAGLLGAVVVAGAGAAVAVMTGFLPNPVVAGDAKASGRDPAASPTPPAAALVKTVRPKRDANLQVTVEQLATVEAYNQVNLRTRVSGLVRAVHKDIGDRVRRGEVLVEIDVPDLDQEVALKEGVVEQRNREVEASEAAAESAVAMLAVGNATVKQRLAEVDAADATREFRRRRLTRIEGMAGSVVANVIDEEQREYQASVAAVGAARAAVEKAQADLKEKESSVKAAGVDITLKQALVGVARKGLEGSRALAAYARVVAPFDGVVLRRTVDPGTFVQNATTGQTEALMTVARTDLVTVVAKFPDTAAPFVTVGTDAVVLLNELPGASLAGRVTRFSPAISASDRTMRVEVDLFNGTRAEYDRLAARTVSGNLAPAAGGGPLDAAVLAAVGPDAALGPRKGAAGGLPEFAGSTATRRLLPGMTGAVRLQLSHFAGAYVVPSGVVYSRTGKPYALLVENGVTKQVPVRVLVSDGTLARITLLGRSPEGQEVARELTGAEELVASRQLEVGDAQPVKTAPTPWQ